MHMQPQRVISGRHDSDDNSYVCQHHAFVRRIVVVDGFGDRYGRGRSPLWPASNMQAAAHPLVCTAHRRLRL
jgi:hypothetical protein